MSNPNLLIEPVSPGILAAKLLLPFGSVDDPVELGEPMTCWHPCSAEAADHTTMLSWLTLWRDAAQVCAVMRRDALVLSLRCTGRREHLLPLLAQMVRSPNLRPTASLEHYHDSSPATTAGGPLPLRHHRMEAVDLRQRWLRP